MKKIFNPNSKNANFLQNFFKSFYILAFCISLFVIGLHQLGVIQGLEFACYDFLFYIRQTEPVDQRITIIEWDEKSLETLREPVISDSNLNKLLKTVLKYRPRVIGLDLYRDLVVPSLQLSQEENLEAYDALNNTFKINSEIIGIQKIVEPRIRASRVLKEESRSAASDISQDKDIRIRQVYIFPNVDGDGSPTEIPYIGISLAYNYLALDNWTADNVTNGLKIHKGKKSIILRPLSPRSNSNNLLLGDSEWKLFLNWRKTESIEKFNSISVTDVINESLDLSSLLSNRLVIIGNVSSYSGDTHRAPIDRWQKQISSSDNWKKEGLTKGVEIVAQVSSSIISAALDGRNLIYPTPLWVIYCLTFLPLLIQAKICDDSFDNSISLSSLGRKIFTWGIFYIFTLALFYIFCFQKFGIWLNVVPAIISTIIGWITYTAFSYSEKEKRDFQYLKLLVKDFKHNIRGTSRQISSANRAIYRNNNSIAQKIVQNSSLFEEDEMEFLEHLIRENIDSITARSKIVDDGINRINIYQKRTTSFLKYTYLDSINYTEIKDLNFEIGKIVNYFILQKKVEYNYSIETAYDNSLTSQKLYLDDWMIIVENLLSNAVYAVDPGLNPHRTFEPNIKVKTVNLVKSIEVVVQDNGIGIPEKFQQKVFMPFVSYKEGRGDGIGLHLISQIVKCRRGKLILKSDTKTGTIFSITLPKIY